MISLLRQIDILGKESYLMVDKKKRFKTTIGGLLTILLVLTSVLAFVAFGRDIIEKNEPQITFWKNPSKDVQFDFYPNITYIITIFDPVKNIAIPELEKLIRVYISTQDINPDKVSEGKSVIEEFFEMEKCPSEKLTSEINKTLFLGFESYYCMPKDVILPLKGTWVSGKSKILKLNIDYCKNTTLNNNSCYSKDMIVKKLPSVFNSHYVIFDNYPEHTDYKYPIKPTLISAITRSNINTMTRLIYWLKNVEYHTDEGWILQSLRNEVFTSIDRIDSQIFPTPNTTTFFSHIFSISPMKENYNRSYIKIQGVAAYIGGFITFFKMSLSIISEYLTKPFYLNFFYEKYFFAATNSENDIEVIEKFNNNNFSSLKLCNKTNNYINETINRDEKKNPKNLLKPDKIKIFNVLFRCQKISDHFSKYLDFIDYLFKENISIEKLCHIICRINIIEDQILKNKELLIEDYNIKQLKEKS